MRIPDPFEADNSHLIIFLIEHPNIESRIFFEVKQLPNTCKSEMIDTGFCSILCNLKSLEHHATIQVVTKATEEIRACQKSTVRDEVTTG